MFKKGNPESKGKPIRKFSEIQREFGMSDPELEDALKPLYHPKLGVTSVILYIKNCKLLGIGQAIPGQ